MQAEQPSDFEKCSFCFCKIQEKRVYERVYWLGTEWGKVGEMSCVTACDVKLIRYF